MCAGRQALAQHVQAHGLDTHAGKARQLTAVAMDSSRMLPRSASTLPSRLVQILDPMRSLLDGSMPYSLGMTASASCFAACVPVRLSAQAAIGPADLRRLPAQASVCHDEL